MQMRSTSQTYLGTIGQKFWNEVSFAALKADSFGYASGKGVVAVTATRPSVGKMFSLHRRDVPEPQRNFTKHHGIPERKVSYV